jgi:hypothetical protein
MWSSWVKTNDTTQVLYIAKLKDGPNRAAKFSQMISERVLKWYDGGGLNGITSKRVFEVEVFFSSQNIDLSFYWKRLLDLFFHSLSLEDLGVLMIFEEKITSSKTSFQLASIYWRWMHIPEWSDARQHG